MISMESHRRTEPHLKPELAINADRSKVEYMMSRTPQVKVKNSERKRRCCGRTAVKSLDKDTDMSIFIATSQPPSSTSVTRLHSMKEAGAALLRSSSKTIPNSSSSQGQLPFASQPILSRPCPWVMSRIDAQETWQTNLGTGQE
jgi:hypothetical protein